MAINKVDFGDKFLSGLKIDCNAEDTKIQVRRLSASAFSSQNPILLAGEPGLEIDTGKIKYGDGTSAWNVLPYSGGGSEVTSVAGRTGDVVLGTSDISGFSSAASAAAPVQSVAGKTGNVALSASDVSGIYPTYANWTQRTLPASASWFSTAYGNGTFVSVASGSNTATTSYDGITWTQRTLPALANWFGVTYGNGTFVAVAFSSNIAATSPDGITWTQRTLPSSSGWYSVAYGNGTFVAVSSNATIAATSADGITWTQRTLPNLAIRVVFGNGIFIALTSGTANTVATSSDGITWTQRTMPASANWFGAAHGNGVFVAVASGSDIAATSSDGITWTQRTLPSSAYWRSVVYGNGTFVALSTLGSNISATSSDGINWTPRTLPATASWQSLAYGSGTFVAVTSGSSVAATNTEVLAVAAGITSNTVYGPVSLVAGRAGAVNLYATDISPAAGPFDPSLLPKATSGTIGGVSAGAGVSVLNGILSANVAEITAGKGIGVSSLNRNYTINANVAGIAAGSGISVSSDGDNNYTISSPGTQATINRSINTNGSAANVSAPFSSTTAQDYVYIFSGAAEGYALVLPTAVNNVNLYTLKNATEGTVYINTSNSETIDGYAQPNPVLGLAVKNSSVTVVSDGANWTII